MILIGTMDWGSTRMRGVFQCPNCDTNQQFRLRSSRPFLTLYFVPIIPIGGVHEFVQCSNCKNSFEKSVLVDRLLPDDAASSEVVKSEAEVATASLQEDLLKVLALMMIEDGHVTENEIRIARRLFENMTEENLTREDLGKICSMVKLRRLNSISFLATARERRTHEEKLLLVQAMFGVAGADGEITTGRMDSLLRGKDVLGLSEREFEEAVEGTSQWLT